MDSNTINKATLVVRIVALLLSAAVGWLGGGYWFEQVWHVPDLRSSVLPSYDLGESAFTGLVLENQERDRSTNVRVSLSNLEYPITGLAVPEPHDDYRTNWVQDEKKTSAWIEVPRLVPGARMEIYLMTEGYETQSTTWIGPECTVGALVNTSFSSPRVRPDTWASHSRSL